VLHTKKIKKKIKKNYFTSFARVFVGVFANVKERAAATLIVPVMFPSMLCD
jgi:hypothetical protein